MSEPTTTPASLPSTKTRFRVRLMQRLVVYTVLLGVLAAILAAVRANADEWIFMWPSRAPFETPGGFEDVEIVTSDGLRLHGWFVRAADAAPGERRPCIVQTHGNAGALPNHAHATTWLVAHGFHVLAFDYRDYGRSQEASGETREDLVTDALAAIEYAAQRLDVDADAIGVHGFSLGSAIGLAAAARDDRVRAFVAQAGFDRWVAIADHHAPILARLLIRPGLDPVDSVAALGDRPLLVIHGDADRIVPIAHGRALYAAAVEAGVEATLVELAGVRHNDAVWLDPRFRDPVASFFRAALKPDAAHPAAPENDERPGVEPGRP